MRCAPSHSTCRHVGSVGARADCFPHIGKRCRCAGYCTDVPEIEHLRPLSPSASLALRVRGSDEFRPYGCLQELVQSEFACLTSFLPGSELNERLFHGKARQGSEFPNCTGLVPGSDVSQIGREVGVKPSDIGFIHGTDVVAIELLQSRLVVFGVGHGSVQCRRDQQLP
jgi:hypothetical protein